MQAWHCRNRSKRHVSTFEGTDCLSIQGGNFTMCKHAVGLCPGGRAFTAPGRPWADGVDRFHIGVASLEEREA